MLNTGIISKANYLYDKYKFRELNYVPSRFVTPDRLIESKSKAWVGLEKIIFDIIQFSGIESNSALEFGVEFGYSTAVFGNYFKNVKGIDIFTGDAHAGHYGDIYEQAKLNLQGFKNIELIKSDYKDYIQNNSDRFDLIHVDIIHTYDDTFDCGLWSAMHSNCTLFHDTQSFRSVKRAVADIAKATNKKFYNYRDCNGLGILI